MRSDRHSSARDGDVQTNRVARELVSVSRETTAQDAPPRRSKGGLSRPRDTAGDPRARPAGHRWAEPSDRRGREGIPCALRKAYGLRASPTGPATRRRPAGRLPRLHDRTPAAFPPDQKSVHASSRSEVRPPAPTVAWLQSKQRATPPPSSAPAIEPPHVRHRDPVSRPSRYRGGCRGAHVVSRGTAAVSPSHDVPWMQHRVSTLGGTRRP